MQIGSASFAPTDAFGGFLGLDGRGFRTRLPVHVHSTYVLGVIDAGSVLVSVAGREFIARPGSVLALAPFTAHRELPLSGDWSFRYLYPSEHAVRFALNLPLGVDTAALPFADPVIEDTALAERIGLVHAMLKAGEGRAVDDMLVRLFQHARERHCIAEGSLATKASHRRVVAVRNELVREPRGRVTLAEMASVAGLSRFRFAHVFRELFGIAPYAYYEQVRIAFAHKLIQQGLGLSTVAFRLGFSDQSHMTRHFRRSSFTTPGRLAEMTYRG